MTTVRATTPDVTVVVPVFNTMPYLLRCLESLVPQTIGRDRMQVVAVDDGSSDGSGEVLDEYAAAHPGLFEIVHQPNSGGPAAPCNRGLELAAGRYVFFLGADDYLGDQALSRLVTKADEWGSDVVAGRLVGVGGRWVSQKLYAETAADVPFPSRILASALSNTKLFRRSMLEEHRIRFPEDLRAGSDQPFTIEALMHARRISVLADYDYYFAVKRDDEQNITYTSTWRARLAAMSQIIARIAALLPAGEGRDAVLARHFSGEVATLLRRDFSTLAEAEQVELMAGVAALANRYLTQGVVSELRVLARLRYHMAQTGDLAGLRDLSGAEQLPVPLRVDAHGLRLGYPAPDDVAPELFRPDVEAPKTLAAGIVPTASLRLEETRLRLTGHTALRPGTAPDGRVVVVRPRRGVNPPSARYRRGGTSPRLSAPLELAVDGTVEAEVDLAGLLPEDAGPSRWAIRLQWDIADHTYSCPVVAAGPAASEVRGQNRRYELSLTRDTDGLALVEIVWAAESAPAREPRSHGVRRKRADA